MYVKSVTLLNVRNYSRLKVEFAPGVNLLYGDNAAGKTNLLEAVFYASSLRSFRGSRVRDIISWGGGRGDGGAEGGAQGGAGDSGGRSQSGHGPDKDREHSPGGDSAEGPGHAGIDGAGRITAAAAPIAGGRSHTLSVTLGRDGRRISLDGKKPESVSEYLLTLKPSGFSPEDLFLAREYPSHRRRFVDRSVFHLDPGYIATANRYRQAVSQLNAALKSGDQKVAASYEEVMAPLAAQVALKRWGYLSRLAPRAEDIFRKVLVKGAGKGGAEEGPYGALGIEYRGGPMAGNGAEDSMEAAAGYYAEKLSAKRAEGMKRGYTSVGPHTEDIVLTLGGRDIKTSASRGQGRLAYLAMVLADGEMYREQTGKHPVLLLDDVVSELDDTRTGALMDYVSGLGQAIITATDDRFLGGRECRRLHVGGGRVTTATG